MAILQQKIYGNLNLKTEWIGLIAEWRQMEKISETETEFYQMFKGE